ncbi:MAG TPA: heavy metal-binding domain-containing protein [Bryobacteraceae bacterium]|jgi:hypothetical protein|nr:heavy metal-binding domain-containing protein [Bryobacteraceae bacterium]
MFRIIALVAVALFCVLHAPPLDPRVLAALNANAAAAAVNASAAPNYPDGEYVCPMDADVRSAAPGYCPRCGMKLVEGIMDLKEYPVNLTTAPHLVRPGEPATLDFDIEDPRTKKPVRDFDIVHEKLFHLFVVSQDLKFFLHTHPERTGNEDFHLNMKFPKPGMYRVLSDFYPRGGTPQLITNTVLVKGEGFHLAPAKLTADLTPQTTENSHVELLLSPPQPVSGEKELMYFRVTPDDGIQPYLGTMGHMLAASSDLIDMIHNHPFQSSDASRNAYKELQFNMIFPRAGVYRVWVQFQRQGVVNTVAFNVPVKSVF